MSYNLCSGDEVRAFCEMIDKQRLNWKCPNCGSAPIKGEFGGDLTAICSSCNNHFHLCPEKGYMVSGDLNLNFGNSR